MSAPQSGPVDERRFTEFVAEEIRRGSSLVPFVGSGLSAPSGIVMGQDFMNYLTWVVYRSVSGKDRLDLREEGWPEAPNAKDVEDARKWVGREFRTICEACKVTVYPEQGPSVEKVWPHPNLLESSIRRPLVPRVLWEPVPEKEGTALLESERNSVIENEDSALRSLLRSLQWEEISRAYSAPPDLSITSESYIRECAIRTLHDWRCTLDFLARLHVGHEGKGLSLWLEETDQTIIDSFNFFITHGRKPNLAHNMLCHLASRARIRCILTTNFDTLLEDAFSELGERFDIIPVGIHGELPAPETVRAQNSIIKLHGALVDTRADVSLDKRPADRDLECFFEYVRGKAPHSTFAPNFTRSKARYAPPTKQGFLPGLLLVCGYSASDLRCVQMIKYLLDADKDGKVLWVCHNRRGFDNLRRIFREQDYKVATEGDDDFKSARIIATVTDRTDLLFYELYQRLTLSLPRGGFNYQFSPNVPPQPHPRACPRPGRINRKPSQTPGPEDPQANQLWQLLKQTANDRIPVVDGSSGLMEPMRALFDYMIGVEQKKGIWLELEDYPDTASLAHELFTIIALRLGRFQLDHARLLPPEPRVPASLEKPMEAEAWQNHVDALIKHWGIAPVDWFIVFYGRSRAGGAAGWEQIFWSSEGNPSEYQNLEVFLTALRTVHSQEKQTAFGMLYAPYSQKRHEEDQKRQNQVDELTEKLRKERRELHQRQGNREGEWQEFDTLEQWMRSEKSGRIRERASHYRVSDKAVHQYEKKKALFNPITLAGSFPTQFGEVLTTISEEWLMEWRIKPEEKSVRLDARRALYAATLFRQARHFSAFLSEGAYPCPCRYNTVGVDNDWLRNSRVTDWLEVWKALPNKGGRRADSIQSLFFHKPGGFAWAYHDARLGVQHLIEGMGPLELVNGSWKNHAAEVRARTHFWIGEWYSRAYRATGHADPLLEALYHFAECIHYCPIAMPLGPEDRHSYRQRLARRAVLQLTKALRLGRRELRLWIQGAAGEPWFGERAIAEVVGGIDVAGNGKPGEFEKVLKELYCDSRRVLPTECEGWLTELRWEMARLPQTEEDKERELRLTTNVGGVTGESAWGTCSPSLRIQRADSPDDYAAWLSGIAKQWQEDLYGSKDIQEFSTLISVLEEDERDTLDRNFDEELKRWRDKVAQPYDPERFFVLAQVTRELAYLFIARAKREHHHKLDADKALILPSDLGKRWIQVCGLCWLTLDLCDELPASLLASETRLRIVACTFYGLALGRLGRFYEAHRRLNEAHAWLSRSKGMREPLDAALIKLRRAEVHLFEALRLRRILDILGDPENEKEPDWFAVVRNASKTKLDDHALTQWASIYLGTSVAESEDAAVANAERPPGAPVVDVIEKFVKFHIAKLDDAWLALEGAQRVLSGKSHSSLWWGHLHHLWLRVYATHWSPAEGPTADLPVALAFRKQRDHFAAVQRTYWAGLVASRADPYHAIRLADYVQKAVEQLLALRKVGSQRARTFIAEVRVKYFPPANTVNQNSLLSSYRDDVEKRLDKFALNQEEGSPDGNRG